MKIDQGNVRMIAFGSFLSDGLLSQPSFYVYIPTPETKAEQEDLDRFIQLVVESANRNAQG